ncbi:hypothetical protein E4U14_000904, partial [Claviceps sp. LM454 group G7]
MAISCKSGLSSETPATGGGNGGYQPGGGNGGYQPGSSVCSSEYYSRPQCCKANFGSFALDCVNPSYMPWNGDDFKSTCNAMGKAPACCTA